MTQIDLTQIKDMENMLTNQDRLVEEAQQRRNELEGYILETKKKLNRGVYQDLVTSSEKEYYLQKLHEMENWLEHHDEKPDIYVDQLEEIKNIFSPIAFRQNNNAECTESTKEFEDCINGQRAAANSTTDFKFPEVYKEIKEAEEWLTACKQLQNMLPKNIDKSQLICEIRQKKKALQESCYLIQTDYNRWFSMKRHYGSQATYSLAQMDGDNASPQIYAKLENKSAPGPMSVFKWFGGFLFGNSRNNEVGDYCQSSRPISNNDVTPLKTKTDGHPEFSPEPSTAAQASDLSTDVKREDMTSKSTENNNLPDVKVDGSEENKKREVDSEENSQTMCSMDKCMQSAREWFESCRSVATKSEREKITGTLDEIDKWFHNGSSAKSQEACMEKQLMIKELLEPIVVRVLVERTPLAIRDLLYCIFRYRVEAISSNEFEKEEINKFCNEAEEWLLGKMEEQNRLSNNVPPALHPDEIMQRINNLNMLHATTMETSLKIMEINLKDYISEIQQKLEGRYNSFTNASERNEISNKIAWVYTWLDDNRNSKSRNFLSDSSSELMKLFDPIERRFKDRENSQTLIDQLTDLIRGYRVRANSLSDRKISSKVNKTCDEYQNWLDNVDPVLPSTLVNVKLQNIQVTCDGLLNQTSQRASSTNQGCYWGSQHPHQGTTGMRSPKRPTSNSNPNSVPRNRGNSNPTVYVNIKIGQAMVKQMVIQMFTDVPKTAGNFLALCTGEKHVSYVGSLIDCVIPKQLCRGGVYIKGQGTMFGVPSFAQENFFRKHTHRGVLSMSTEIYDPKISHGSGFIICFRNAPELDGKYVVFGEITEGIDVLDQIEAVGMPNGAMREEVVIVGCGRIN